MKMEEYRVHDRNYPDVKVLRRNLEALKHMQSEAERDLEFQRKYGNNPEKIAEYRRRINSYRESEQNIEKEIKKAEKELNSHNYLCPRLRRYLLNALELRYCRSKPFMLYPA